MGETNSKYVKIAKKHPWSKPRTCVRNPYRPGLGWLRVGVYARWCRRIAGFPPVEEMTNEQVREWFRKKGGSRQPN